MTNNKLKQYIERIERLEDVIKDHNSEKSDIYKTAKGDGYDPKIIRKCVSIRRNGAAKHEEESELIATYLREIDA